MLSKVYNNGVAGLHITGSHSVSFEATAGEGGNDSGSSMGEGNVGSLDGDQPIEIIVDSSTFVTFTDMRVTSANGTRNLSPSAAFICFRLLFTRSNSNPLLALETIRGHTGSPRLPLGICLKFSFLPQYHHGSPASIGVDELIALRLFYPRRKNHKAPNDLYKFP